MKRFGANFISVFIGLIVASVSQSANACTPDGREGIVPKNNVVIPVSAFSNYGTTEEQFDAAAKKADTIYAPKFRSQGRVLKVVANWQDGTANADTVPNGRVSTVNLYGGLARHPKMTADAFMLVICHEIGHHLGGAPRKTADGSDWASNEGQSDYFATLKCAREIWKDEDNHAAVSQIEVPSLVTEKCQKGFNTPDDIALCQRSAIASNSLTDAFAALDRESPTHFETPDTRIVQTMDDSHPKNQCRLDTYLAGAICHVSKDSTLSTKNPTKGTCSQEKGEVLGIRPLCWYKPADRNTGIGSSWPTAF